MVNKSEGEGELYFHLASHPEHEWEYYMPGVGADLDSDDLMKMEEDAQEEAVKFFHHFGFKKSHNEGHDKDGDLVNRISNLTAKKLGKVWEEVELLSGDDEGTIHLKQPLFFIREWIYLPYGEEGDKSFGGEALYGEQIREWLEEQEIPPFGFKGDYSAPMLEQEVYEGLPDWDDYEEE